MKMIHMNVMRLSTKSDIMTFDLRGYLVPKRFLAKWEHIESRTLNIEDSVSMDDCRPSFRRDLL